MLRYGGSIGGNAMHLSPEVLTATRHAGSLVEGCVSWFLLYRFRTFERQMGSARFSLFLVLAAAWAVGTRAAALAVLPDGRVASGSWDGTVRVWA